MHIFQKTPVTILLFKKISKYFFTWQEEFKERKHGWSASVQRKAAEFYYFFVTFADSRFGA